MTRYEIGLEGKASLYEIDLDRKFGGYEKGDIICSCCPFGGTSLKSLNLEIAIRRTGEIIFRGWGFGGNGNPYLHVYESDEERKRMREEATQEQRDTVSGLLSGRIAFEGLKLLPGTTLQEVCPVDIKREEELTGKRIYLSAAVSDGKLVES